MKREFIIEGVVILVDTEMTQKFYLTQNKTVDGCKCTDCLFYVNVFTKQNFEIFKLLKKMGVDLEKNLSSEPTGVWCVRDDNGDLIHCDQAYQVIANISPNDRNEIRYTREEKNHKVEVRFIQLKVDNLFVSLSIDLIEN
jgi:hypothetical protein